MYKKNANLVIFHYFSFKSGQKQYGEQMFRVPTFTKLEKREKNEKNEFHIFIFLYKKWTIFAFFFIIYK